MNSKYRLKSISRIDSRKAVGWYVRVKHNGVEHRKFFSDGVYGNKLSALVAAKKYRDELEVKLGKPRTDRPVTSTNKRNRSGVVGVRMREFPAFEAQACIEPGKVRKVLVPIRNGNVQEAFEKACRIRQQMLEQAWNKNDGGKLEF
ncbi:MAG: AP2 domain-containing protein [Blastocatellia bacterium]